MKTSDDILLAINGSLDELPDRLFEVHSEQQSPITNSLGEPSTQEEHVVNMIYAPHVAKAKEIARSCALVDGKTIRNIKVYLAKKPIKNQ